MNQYSITDALLLFEQASKGNSHAFENIIQLYKEPLQQCIEKYISRQDPSFDDVMQEVWMILWRQSASIKEKDNPLSWAIKISRNIAISTIRKQKNNSYLDLNLESGHHEESILEKKIASSYNRHILLKAMENLSQRQQELIIQRFFKGYSYKKIARICDISQHTVRNQLSLARKIMRNNINRFWAWVLVFIKEIDIDAGPSFFECIGWGLFI